MSLLRMEPSVRSTLDQKQNGDGPIKFENEGLCEICSPFWTDLPHSNIFLSITPDILHQIHKGVFKDHFVKWCNGIAGEDVIDARSCSMSWHLELWHFSKSLSSLSQWTGKENKERQKVYLSILAGVIPAKVLATTQGLLDFTYYAQYQSHMVKTLNEMQHALDKFHTNKDAFSVLGIHEHFNILKLHSMTHNVLSIQNFRRIDGLNSEGLE